MNRDDRPEPDRLDQIAEQLAAARAALDQIAEHLAELRIAARDGRRHPTARQLEDTP